MESLEDIRKWVVKPSLLDLAHCSRYAGQCCCPAAGMWRVLWTAFAAPGAVTEVYDAIAAGAAGEALDSTSWQAEECAIPESFWETFADTLTGPEQGYDATTITVAVAALGGCVAVGELAESAAQQHPGSNDAASQAIPELTDIDALGGLPEGSLGNDLYRMLVDNNFDAEVLDREVIGLANLHPSAALR